MGFKRTMRRTRVIDIDLDRDILRIKKDKMSYRAASKEYVKQMKEIRWRLIGLMEKSRR